LYYLSASAMECPTCRRVLPKSYWYPSQWSECSHQTYQFDRCKICYDIIPAECWDGQYRNDGPCAAPYPAPRAATSADEWEARFSALALEISHDSDFLELQEWWKTVKFSRAMYSAFVAKWMEMPKQIRKALSHFGAVESSEGTPTHYRCHILDKQFFDPGNQCYAIVFDILCGIEYSSKTGFNAVTKGDVFEGLLGYAWLRELDETQTVQGGRAHPQLSQARWVSQLLNFVVDRIYRLMTRFHRDGFREVVMSLMGYEPAFIPTETPTSLRIPKVKWLGNRSIHIVEGRVTGIIVGDL